MVGQTRMCSSIAALVKSVVSCNLFDCAAEKVSLELSTNLGDFCRSGEFGLLYVGLSLAWLILGGLKSIWFLGGLVASLFLFGLQEPLRAFEWSSLTTGYSNSFLVLASEALAASTR